MSTSVVSHGDAAPILELGEQVFDFMTPAIALCVVRNGLFSAPGRRDARLDAFFQEGMAQPVAVATSVSNKKVGGGKLVENEPGALAIAHPAFTRGKDDWPPLVVAHRMKLGVQPAFGASDTAGNIPFLSRLAAVQCAFR